MIRGYVHESGIVQIKPYFCFLVKIELTIPVTHSFTQYSFIKEMSK